MCIHPCIMNILTVGKKSAQLCVSTLMMSIILLPAGAAESVPVPASKPVIIDGLYVPIPSKKPTYNSSNTDSISARQSKLYAAIFKAQALGNMDKADILLDKISDTRLIGHVLSQRYMHSSYRSSFDELQNWMELYADNPNAGKIYKLALSKQPSDSILEITKPRNGRLLPQINEPTIYYPKIYISKISRDANQAKLVKSLSRKVKSLIRSGESLEALDYFQSSTTRDFMDDIEQDILQTRIAAGFLYGRDFENAYKLSSEISDRSGLYVPKAAWVAGLAAWQQKKFDRSAFYFDIAGKSPYASGWLSSAGSYWAARSYKHAGNQDKSIAALENAAKHSRTFYGLMATQSLGNGFGFDWTMPKYSPSHEALILENPAGKRTFSLVAAGQYDLAGSELLRLNYKGNAPLRRAVLAYAAHVGLPSVAMRLGNMVRRPNGGHYDGALYPVTQWSPKNGYDIDSALIHAIMRQESRFNQAAYSHSGAIGLMQIMPKTAQYVASNNGYTQNINSYSLHFPEINISIGQDYLEYLLKSRAVGGDIISMLVAYNAGPGNLAKWRSRMGGNNDALLFIEMIPVKETRNYVEHVLSNYWIYRHRAGLGSPSLAALAGGKASIYANIMQSDYPYKLAAN